MNTGRVAVITGGAGGIGQATAQVLAQKGYFVALVDRLGAFAKNAYSQYGTYECDVTNHDMVQEIKEYICIDFGRIDVLVNAAGWMPDTFENGMKRVQNFRPDELATVHKKLYDINVLGTELWCNAVAPEMIRQRCGSIVNLSSIAGSGAMLGQSIYAGTKAAVAEFTRTLAGEIVKNKNGDPFNIRVNAVAPGIVRTQLTENVPDAVLSAYKGRCMLGRLAEPAEIARVICFLASDDASYITGATFFVDGGFSVAF